MREGKAGIRGNAGSRKKDGDCILFDLRKRTQ